MSTGATEQSFCGDIAIVGMSVCVPGAATAAQFRDNLRDGVGPMQVLDRIALGEAGERPDLIAHKNYVPAAARLGAATE